VPKAVIVVPCFNEERRLDSKGFVAFAAEEVELLFVDDGSTDGTRAALDALCLELHGRGVQAQVLAFDRNGGKAEAVRRGMLRALDSGASIVGYFDADLATPPAEVGRLIATLTDRSADAVLASRVLLLGTRIRRRPARHYLGRIFATAASLLLRMPVYDTQCGAKVFRRSPALDAALGQPFSARWAFDVELIGRLHSGTGAVPGLAISRFVEMPLREWRDVSGSTLRARMFPLLGLELLRIALALRRWRAE
jgi:glycosyltransferase involved in cell wall biosynthesis